MANRGFQRIGFVNDSFIDRRNLRSYSSAFLTAQAFAPDRVEREMITLDMMPRGAMSPKDATRLRAWCGRFRPDVVIYPEEGTLAAIRKAAPGLPEKLPAAYALLCLPPASLGPHRHAGVDEDWPGMAERAVEILVSHLQHGRYGLPAKAVRTLVSCAWQDGPSLGR